MKNIFIRNSPHLQNLHRYVNNMKEIYYKDWDELVESRKGPRRLKKL
jgi:hypothetical protein